MSLIIKTTGWEDYLDPAGGSWIKCLIMGPPDVGKTRSASFWPKPIFADCEGGRMSLADRKVPYADIKSTADMDALVKQLAIDSLRPAHARKYQTLVIDTIDHYQKIAVSERLKSEKKEALSGWADWGWLDAHMQQFVEKVLNLNMNVVMNVHFKMVTEGEDDAKKVSQALRLKGDVKDWLLEEFDLIGMMESTYKAENGTRVRRRHIRWHNEPAYPLLKDRSGSLPQFTDIDFTEDDYNRVFQAITSKVDDLPASTDVEEIEVEEDPQVDVPGPDVQGGPVDPGKLPEKKAAAKKTVAKKVPKKVAEAEPGEATVVDPTEKGTKDFAVVVDPNKAVLTNYNHAHSKDGICLKNRYGARCGSPVAPPRGDPGGGVSTDVPTPEVAPPSTPDPSEADKKDEDPAVALVKDEMGATEVSSEEHLPTKYCGKQPDSHKKFPAVKGCGKDLDTEIPAKVNLALLRAKTMLCTSCFDTWKAEQSA